MLRGRYAALLEQHNAVADDRIQGRAQFMAHVGQKQALELVRCLGGFLCPDQFLLLNRHRPFGFSPAGGIGNNKIKRDGQKRKIKKVSRLKTIIPRSGEINRINATDVNARKNPAMTRFSDDQRMREILQFLAARLRWK